MNIPNPVDTHTGQTLTLSSHLKLACFFFVAALGSIFLSRQPGNIATLWYANAICAGFLWDTPKRQWFTAIFACILANMAANLLFGDSVWVTIAFIPANFTEILVCVWLARRVGASIDSGPLGVVRLAAISGFLAPFVGACIGAWTVSLQGVAPFWTVWFSWYGGAAIGYTSLLPLVISLRQGDHLTHQRQDYYLLLALSLLTVAVAIWALRDAFYPFVFVLVPLITTAIMSTVLGTAVVTALASLSVGTMIALHIFISPPITERWQQLLIYIPILLTVVPPQILAATLHRLRMRERSLAHQQHLLDAASGLAHLGAWEHAPAQPFYGSVQFYAVVAGILESKMPPALRFPQTDDTGPKRSSVWDMLLPYLDASSQKALLDALEAGHQGAHWDLELCATTHSGRQVWLRHMGRSEKQPDGRYRKWGIVQDITVQKSLEMMQRQFVATVSHELRTPLTALRGAFGLLQTTQAQQLATLPSHSQKLLDIAGRNTERLVELVNTILDYEKLRAGQTSLRLVSLRVVALVGEVVDRLSTYASQFQVQCLIQQEDHDIFVYADAARLDQVLSNLLSNAIKFSKNEQKGEQKGEQKSEHIRITWLSQDAAFCAVQGRMQGAMQGGIQGATQGVTSGVTSDDERGWVEIRVWNAGGTISDEFRARIFSPFQQADNTDRRSHGGTGLGLSISKQLVEAMGGHIGFESAAETGTTFWIRLPKGAPLV